MQEAVPHHPLQAPTSLENLTTEEVWNRIQQERMATVNDSVAENYMNYAPNNENHTIENIAIDSQRHQVVSWTIPVITLSAFYTYEKIFLHVAPSCREKVLQQL